jgi:hypothetical protein
MAKREIHIITGGTMFHVAPHFSLCAPAFGNTGRELYETLKAMSLDDVFLHETRLANPSSKLETNDDVARLLDSLQERPEVKMIFLPVALCDFEGSIGNEPVHLGKKRARLDSRQVHTLKLRTAPKLIEKIRRHRKDIFVVAFKTTTNCTDDEMFDRGLSLMKRSSCNLVFVNDIHLRRNMIVTPEQARYASHPEEDFRKHALIDLAFMATERAKGTFTRTTVEDGPLIPWDDSRIPSNLRTVVDHCIARGAYAPFEGKTVGHFAVKLGENEYATSIRKSNFNTDLRLNGLVRVVAAEDGTNVVSFGDRPSVGGQSQRIIFRDHPEARCIVHFHCPVRPGAFVPSRSQVAHECGSHQCGENTSSGLREVAPGIKAVMLEKHGPNIVFGPDVDPYDVIEYIEAHFSLERTTRERQIDSFEYARITASPA